MAHEGGPEFTGDGLPRLSPTMQIVTLAVRLEHDVVLARRRARQIAEQLGFNTQDQTRLATAVSELARNCYSYAGHGEIKFLLVHTVPAQTMVVEIRDHGPGIANLADILAGRYQSKTGMGLGIIGARRLMDSFHIESVPGLGTTVRLEKSLPANAPRIDGPALLRIASSLAQQAQSPFEEMQQQNQDLLHTQEELHRGQEQLATVNRELDEKAERLRRADALKTAFLSNMSHEFRTPVNSILGLSRLLLRETGGTLTAEQEQQVSFIRKAAEGLSDLINDLLDIAKIEAGKEDIRQTRFEVAGIFSTLRGVMEPLAVNPAVQLIFSAPEGLPPLYSDSGKLMQILRNFITNALKFTVQGEVRVTAELAPAGSAIIFAVADTGIGIAEADRERIFQDFVQVDSARQRQVKGTGLGLSLVRKLAALIGAGVSLANTPGAGSTFSVSVPIASGDQAAPDAPEVAVTLRQEPLERLLHIDDEAASRYLFKKILAEQHCTVSEAAGGIEGLRRACVEHPQVILLDLDMPDISGFEFLERLRADPQAGSTPVIVYTARTLTGEERRQLERDTVAIIAKDDMANDTVLSKFSAALQQIGLALYPLKVLPHAG